MLIYTSTDRLKLFWFHVSHKAADSMFHVIDGRLYQTQIYSKSWTSFLEIGSKTNSIRYKSTGPIKGIKHAFLRITFYVKNIYNAAQNECRCCISRYQHHSPMVHKHR